MSGQDVESVREFVGAFHHHPRAFAPGFFVARDIPRWIRSKPVNTYPDDDHFMREALRLGRHALGRSTPNPAVGAVVVQGEEVVGRGGSLPAGESHAEIVALRDAGAQASGATLYITLEPCRHHGLTPPCTDAIIAAGIRRCVVAVEDPFPLVAGEGIAQLKAAGITVDAGVAAPEAAELHAGFFSRIRTGRPLVRAKYAMSLDGRIATRTGNSRWITGTAARRHAHVMRDRADALLVGAGTVLADDPSLTTRLPSPLTGTGGAHHPLRIIVDGRGTSSASARVYDPGLPGRTLVATTTEAPSDWLDALAVRGVDHVLCGAGPRVDLEVLLDNLGERGLNEILVEGGGRLLGSFFDAGLVNRVAAFVAPVIIGGADAQSPVMGRGIDTMAAAWRLSNFRLQTVGDDVLLEGTIAAVPSLAEVA